MTTMTIEGHWVRRLAGRYWHFFQPGASVALCARCKLHDNEVSYILDADDYLHKDALQDFPVCANCIRVLTSLEHKATLQPDPEPVGRTPLDDAMERVDKGECCPVMTICHNIMRRVYKKKQNHRQDVPLAVFCCYCPNTPPTTCPELVGPREHVCEVFSRVAKSSALQAEVCAQCVCVQPPTPAWHAAFANWQREQGIRERIETGARRQLYEETIWMPGEPQHS